MKILQTLNKYSSFLIRRLILILKLLHLKLTLAKIVLRGVEKDHSQITVQTWYSLRTSHDMTVA